MNEFICRVIFYYLKVLLQRIAAKSFCNSGNIVFQLLNN